METAVSFCHKTSVSPRFWRLAAGNFNTKGKQQYRQKGSEERLVTDRIQGYIVHHYVSFGIGSTKTSQLVISERQILIITITLTGYLEFQ